MDRSDNRFSNFRPASDSQNNCNCGPRATNRSGIKGVSWDERCGQWFARITFQGRSIWLGYFKSKELAGLAYQAVAKKYHGEFARFE